MEFYAFPQTASTIQSALVIRTTFVPLCFSERNLIASGTYECSYSQRNYLVFWKSVLMADVLIARVLYDVLITRVLITRVDCISVLERMFGLVGFYLVVRFNGGRINGGH